MKHPDLKFVDSVIQRILLKKRLSTWKVDGIRFSFFPSRYDVDFSNGTEKKTVAVVTEHIDEIAKSDSPLTRRKIKKLFKQVLLPGDLSDD